jgi:predicted TIM-barrel fold metal-dependent hydrolase
VQRLDIVVGMHSGDPGYQRYLNEWEGFPGEMLPFKATGSPAFQAMASQKVVVHDAMASIIGHGLATRFPRLRFMPVEFQAEWIRPFILRIQSAYERSPVLFDEDPFEVFKRNIYVHIFHEPDPQELLDMGLTADRLMFGSDFPHPEGIADPLGYSEVVENLKPEDRELIMGGTLAQAMKVAA